MYKESDYKQSLLDPDELRFYRSQRGGLVMCIGGEKYRDLNIRRAFPLEETNRFIGFFLADGTELGLLEDIEALDTDSRMVLAKELEKIYFRPAILRIHTIGEEFGVVFVDAKTSSGHRHIEIRQIRNKIRLLSRYRALIEDVDGNRYELRDWNRLPKMTRAILSL